MRRCSRRRRRFGRAYRCFFPHTATTLPHQQPIFIGVALGPDARTLATASDDRVRVWDLGPTTHGAGCPIDGRDTGVCRHARSKVHRDRQPGQGCRDFRIVDRSACGPDRSRGAGQYRGLQLRWPISRVREQRCDRSGLMGARGRTGRYAASRRQGARLGPRCNRFHRGHRQFRWHCKALAASGRRRGAPRRREGSRDCCRCQPNLGRLVKSAPRARAARARCRRSPSRTRRARRSAGPSARSSPNSSDASCDSRARIQLMLPRSVLISPLWAIIAVRVRELPARERVRREARVDERERAS